MLDWCGADVIQNDSVLTNRDRLRLERQQDALIAQLRGLGNLRRGTVVEVMRLVGISCFYQNGAAGLVRDGVGRQRPFGGFARGEIRGVA